MLVSIFDLLLSINISNPVCSYIDKGVRYEYHSGFRFRVLGGLGIRVRVSKYT